MTELLDTVASWPSLLLVLVVFGFAPGFCLRLIVLAYPRDDPRRAELIAELYGVPRIERPLWVTEQLEVALFEGVPHRWAAFLRWLARRHRTEARPTKRLMSRRQFVDMVGVIWRWIVFGGGTVGVTVGMTVSGIEGGIEGGIVIVIAIAIALVIAITSVGEFMARFMVTRRTRRDRATRKLWDR